MVAPFLRIDGVFYNREALNMLLFNFVGAIVLIAYYGIISALLFFLFSRWVCKYWVTLVSLYIKLRGIKVCTLSFAHSFEVLSKKIGSAGTPNFYCKTFPIATFISEVLYHGSAHKLWKGKVRTWSDDKTPVSKVSSIRAKNVQVSRNEKISHCSKLAHRLGI